MLRRLPPIYFELAKARLSALVVATAAVSYVVAAGDGPLALAGLVWTALGTALATGGANALNQWIEVERDRRMERTKERPLPTERIGSKHALLFGLVAAVAGPILLALFVNALSALLALFAALLYVLVYTPLKARTPFCTLVGAVCGALPPLIGWAGATGGISAGGLVLFALLFAWQIPHFLALAWLYREDYARAGFRMLPAIDPNGRVTFHMVMLYTLALLPTALAAALVGAAGPIYAAGSLLLGLGLLFLGAQLYAQRNNAAAKRLFLASVVYLPLLLGLLALDRGPAGQLSRPAEARDAVEERERPARPELPGESASLPPISSFDG